LSIDSDGRSRSKLDVVPAIVVLLALTRMAGAGMGCGRSSRDRSVVAYTKAALESFKTFPVLVTEAHQHTPIGCVLADAEFDLQRNPSQQLKADSVIPAKRRSSCKASGVRFEMREHFPTQQYAKRSLIEDRSDLSTAVLVVHGNDTSNPQRIERMRRNAHTPYTRLTTSTR
jgi:hypothetical protein